MMHYFKKAINLYKKALILDPDNPSIFLFIGEYFTDAKHSPDISAFFFEKIITKSYIVSAIDY